MKIVKPSAEIIEDKLCEMSIYQRIAYCAGVCYQREPRKTEEEAQTFCKRMVEIGHHSTLEMAVVHISIPHESADIYSGEKFLHVSAPWNQPRAVVSGSIRAWFEVEGEYGSHVWNFLAKELPVFFAESDPPRVMMRFAEPHETPWQHRHVAVRFIVNRAMCYDDETQVLTKDGWKYFAEITNEDEFFTWNDKGNAYEKATAVINEPYAGEMITGESTMVDFCVTPNHRMLWWHFDARKRGWRINEAIEVEGRRVKFQRGLVHEWEGTPITEDYPQQSEIDFARFFGVFITDGCINKKNGNGGKVVLSQTKKFGRDYIKKTLDALGWRYSENKNGFEIGNSKLHAFLEKYFPFGEERRKLTCRVPSWIKNAPKEYIEAFIEGVIVGDGNVCGKSNHRVIYTCNEELAGDYQECILKMGKCSTVRNLDRIGAVHYIKGIKSTKRRKEYIVSITDRTNEHLFNKPHWGRKEYSGRVHCVSIPSGLLYVRRNGKAFWCGNSHELVRHRAMSWLQESQRYCRYEDEVVFIRPEWWQKGIGEDHLEEDWLHHMSACENRYREFLQSGLKPQQARAVLPNSTKTELIAYASLPQWKHMFNLRCSPAADPEMIRVMRPLREEFMQQYPEAFTGGDDW